MHTVFICVFGYFVTAVEAKVTYDDSQEYVLNKFRLKISTLNEEPTKAKHDIIERKCYKKGATIDALKCFKMATI